MNLLKSDRKVIFKIQCINIQFKWTESVICMAAAVPRSGTLFLFFILLMRLSSERMYYNIELIKILGIKLRNFYGDWSGADLQMLGVEYQMVCDSLW